MKKLKDFLQSEETSDSVMLPDRNTNIFDKLDRDFNDTRKKYKTRDKEINKELED